MNLFVAFISGMAFGIVAVLGLCALLSGATR
jgi:hypothetical protein